ncbi:ParB/RepB/Spo0J family partition protein [Agrobacterium sp. Azo12]|jgi:ParB family chromosome partitioning protein|uniref:ParB/RepB/Spo0J family partition protein n=1 Tax=Agrobacterium sp. Azo12 TaxID=3031129 RepID=UPI0023D8934D|nr:ParB/RepB/Spo0J family partition protein [Agrobacterium sp. Azo12]MDO5897032.1 ParB/RepB/Spo0J family partition protein [Agrobacterium sp. Azo12]
MAQAIQKITLNAGRDIPFNKLVLSQQNVRKTKAGVSIEELAEDIAHRGLLTSLNVRPEVDGDGKETGIYRIPAGGRRYRALELLVSQEKLTKTVAIPCIISKGDTLEVEDSLAENVTRVDLHPLDEFRAIMTLREQGLDDEDIAARFHMSVATVRQRLRLASVSPRLLEIYASDEMKLGQVMAFSITNDHVRQEQVWDTISRSNNQDAYYIRRMLTETAVRAIDRRAVYVGVEAYEAAGGVVMRDLFEQDNGGWLQDPALLEQLVLEKLTADAQVLKRQEGWKWVDAAFDFPYGHASGLRRFYGERAEFSDEELARHDTLKAEYDKLDAEYAKADEQSDETEDRLEALGNELDALNDRPCVFDPEEVARGGAFVSLAANGELKIERGFVRPEDEPGTNPDGDGNDDGDSDGEAGEGATTASANGGASINGRPAAVEEQDAEDGKIRPLSDRLVEDLTAARTVALRNALANDPVIAFIAALHAAVLKIFYRHAAGSCLEITLEHTAFSQTQGLGDTAWAKEIEQRQEAWGYDLPANGEEVWDYLVALDEASRMALFAHCVSLSVNTTVQAWNRRAKENIHAKQLARSLGFGMVAAGWTPTVDNYLGRITKAHILQAVREAKGEQAAQLIDHLKKTDMAREAARLLEGSGWLPEMLRLPSDEAAPVAEVDAVTVDDVAEENALESVHVDLPAFLAEDQDAEKVSTDQNDDDGEHMEAAE